jgi:hypothetical protein
MFFRHRNLDSRNDKLSDLVKLLEIVLEFYILETTLPVESLGIIDVSPHAAAR